MASVLVCDDEPLVVELLRTLLEAQGYLVPVASTGEEAVALTRLHRPDLLLLDMELPDMSGIDLLRRVRDEPGCEETSAIFLTGNEDPGVRAKALDSGAAGYVFKRSMRSEELMTQIGRHIDQAHRARGAAPTRHHVGGAVDTTRVADPGQALTQIGGWVLQRKLARGGMGDVYVAQRGEDRCALKVLPRDYDLADEIAQRFLREIAILRRLDHPHIVRYLESGFADERPYLAMELVEAPNLHQLTRDRGPIDAALARLLLHQVAAALICARDLGVTHRDIKPSNILVGESSCGGATTHARVCDFGVAHLRLARHEQGDTEQLTRHGYVVGTPSFVSPEHARGRRDIDQRQDIYGLGATLYDALVGHPPFQGDIDEVLLFKQIEDPDLEPLAAVEDPALVACIAGMLARDPEHRLPTWEAVLETAS